MSDLMAFHLGPVQEFIATARRTQDWWMGSWLLAHLSRTACDAAQGHGAELVLPALVPAGGDATLADTPNHFAARVSNGNATEVARAAEDALRTEWARLCSNVKSAFFRDAAEALWQRQVTTFLEVYWSIVPDDGTPAARHRCQAALDARKRLRDFQQTEEQSIKCSLCGARQELSGRASIREAREWWADLTRRFAGRLRVRGQGAERLCAVCSVKRTALSAGAFRPRLGKDDGHFPSTSSVAAATFKRRLLETGRGRKELKAHLDVVESELCVRPQVDADCLPGLARLVSDGDEVGDRLLRFDGDLFFTGTFTERRFRSDFPEIEGRLLEAGAAGMECSIAELLYMEPDFVSKAVSSGVSKATSSLRALLRSVRSDRPTEHIAQPSTYFAVVKLDGDRMGAFFGQADEQQARAVSERLSHFARETASEVVSRHLGRLVYAGGDDLLAFAPLAEVLTCARELEGAFKTAVRSVANPKELQMPTPSVGIVIAHRTAPLDAILTALNRAERAAKSDYRRDAVCIHVLKRSGEEVRVGSRWRYGDLEALEVASRLSAQFEAEAMSMKFAQALAAEAWALNDHKSVPAEARAAAIRRLALRHCASGQKEAALALAGELAAWAEGKNDERTPLGIQEVANWGLLARFIASGGRDDE